MGSPRARPVPLSSFLFPAGTLGPEGLQRLTGECWAGTGTGDGQLLMCFQGRTRGPLQGASAAVPSPLLLQGALGPRGDTGPPGPPGPPVSKGCSGQTPLHVCPIPGGFRCPQTPLILPLGPRLCCSHPFIPLCRRAAQLSCSSRCPRAGAGGTGGQPKGLRGSREPPWITRGWRRCTRRSAPCAPRWSS